MTSPSGAEVSARIMLQVSAQRVVQLQEEVARVRMQKAQLKLAFLTLCSEVIRAGVRVDIIKMITDFVQKFDEEKL